MAIATATLIPQFNTQNLPYVRALLAPDSKSLPELYPLLPRLDTVH